MKILILEDSEIIAKGIKRYINELYGCHDIIIITIDAKRALVDSYDIAIVDYNFGIKLWNLIKCKDKLIISGDHMGVYSRFLEKPFDKYDFKKAMDKIIENI